MPAPEPRQIKKPRISLSCIVCRRRKVRCGREQPECANCVRMKETCVYQAMVRDETTGRVRPASPQNRNHSGSDPRPGVPGAQPDSHVACLADQPSRPPSVPCWEAAIQFPIDPRPTPLCPDHLSLRRGGHIRYISPMFWGFVAGKESLSQDFFDENRHAPPGLPLPHISSMGMFNILRFLPTKPVSDALLESFLSAVWPLSPLLHRPTLQAEYDQVWDWCRNSESALPAEKLRDDPTFFCLLFGVLYCGASAAPATSWAHSTLYGLQKETTVSELKLAYTTSLSLCQHQEHPTLNTLISTLLTRAFLDRHLEPMRNLIDVSTTVRIAQMMGLHRERAWSALSPVDQGIRRRVWWHIVSLDVQSSISTGLNLCCGTDALEGVGMVTLGNEEASNLSGGMSPPDQSMASGQSVATVYAIGRFQVAHIQAKIVAHLQSPQGPTEKGFKELVVDAKQLVQRVNSLTALISKQGIPERDSISSVVVNTSPFTPPLLYTDDTSQSTVFAAWTRIMLTLLKFEVAILLQKPFLVPPDSTNPQSHKSWNGIVQLCMTYLRIYQRLYQTPAFAPYAWFCCSQYGPFQCVFVTLVYLYSFPDSEEIFLARKLVDEVLHHFMTHYHNPSSTSNSPKVPGSNGAGMQMPLALQVLMEFHNRLDSPREPHNQTPSLLETASFHLPAASSQTSSEISTSSTNFLAIIAELEVWSSLIIQESGDILANSNDPISDRANIPGFGASSTVPDPVALSEGPTFQT